MPKLRESTKKEIVDLLDKTHFTAGNFSINFSNENDPFIDIKFLPNENLYFKVETFHDFRETQFEYRTSEAPGQHFDTEEKYKHENLTSTIESITPWVERILEDYRTKNPFLDEFEKFQQSLNQQLNDHLGDNSAHFSEEEVASLTQKLNELNQKIEKIAKENEVNEYKLQQAQKEIEGIKSDLSTFPKSVWYRMAGKKISKTIKDVIGTPETRQFILEAAKKFLLEGPE